MKNINTKAWIASAVLMSAGAIYSVAELQCDKFHIENYQKTSIYDVKVVMGNKEFHRDSIKPGKDWTFYPPAPAEVTPNTILTFQRQPGNRCSDVQTVYRDSSTPSDVIVRVYENQISWWQASRLAQLFGTNNYSRIERQSGSQQVKDKR